MQIKSCISIVISQSSIKTSNYVSYNLHCVFNPFVLGLDCFSGSQSWAPVCYWASAWLGAPKGWQEKTSTKVHFVMYFYIASEHDAMHRDTTITNLLLVFPFEETMFASNVLSALMYLNIMFIWMITLCFAHISIHHYGQCLRSCSWWCFKASAFCPSCYSTSAHHSQAQFHTTRQFSRSMEMSIICCRNTNSRESSWPSSSMP